MVNENEVKDSKPRGNRSNQNRPNENKVYWASRRGMLELDLVLMPFAKNVYPGLSSEDQLRYQQLLEQEDQDLFSWFLGSKQSEDPQIKQTVDFVLSHTGSRGA